MRHFLEMTPKEWYDWHKNQFKYYCRYCPPHDGDNAHGKHSQWGKKKASKTLYATGKGRKKPKNFYKGTRYQNWGYPSSEGGWSPNEA